MHNFFKVINISQLNDVVLDFVFIIELFVKIKSLGFCLDSGAFIWNRYDVLDITDVLVGCLSLVPIIAKISSLMSLNNEEWQNSFERLLKYSDKNFAEKQPNFLCFKPEQSALILTVVSQHKARYSSKNRINGF